MGKEGGYWGGRSFKKAEADTPSGCISAFFHLFDFYPFHFSLQNQPQASSNCHHDTVTIPKGTEAPRNSLESVDGPMVGSISSKEETSKIPKNNKLFIKTSTGVTSNGNKLGSNVNDLSPGTKTPTLVARLMGLDLLPDAQSPSSSSPSSCSTITTTSSCLSSTKSQVNPHLNHHRLRPRQHNVIITKPRHSMDDSIAASRFLPETPRISSARRSDVEHRLSLQINKENMGVGEDLELPRFSFSKLQKFEEHQHSCNNKSPRHYAKQIVKQMKESMMSRKVGIDVTNTVKNNRTEKQERGGEVAGQFIRSKKSPRAPTSSSSVSKFADNKLRCPVKVSNYPSCSPRLRFMDPMNKLSTVTMTGNKDQISPQPAEVKFDNQPLVVSRVLVEAKPQAASLEEQQAKCQKQKSSVPKCKKAANEKFSPRLKKKPMIRNKRDESFVRPLSSPNRASDIMSTSKSKKNHPLLINLLNLNTVQNINSNTLPAVVSTQIPQKQVCDAREPKYCSSRLFSGSSRTYTKEATSSPPSWCILSTTTTAESNVDELDKRKASGSMFNNNNGPELEYVSSILSRTGLAVKKGRSTTTTVSVSLFHQWLSPTQPLDPAIFHHLEQQFQNQNQNPTSDIFSASSQDGNLRPKYDPGVRSDRRLLFDLVNETLLEAAGPCDAETVWERIAGRFQNKKCEVPEDVDALIEMEDMGKMKMKSAEAMVAEIEGNIMDTLLHETVRMVTECGGGTERTTRTTPFSREATESRGDMSRGSFT